MRLKPFVPDLVIALLIALPTFFFCLRASHWDPSQIRRAARDIYFDNDSNRVFDAETDRMADNNDRVTLHPMYPYLTFPPVAVLRTVARREPVVAVKIFHSGVAALWMAAFFLLLRWFSCRRFDAALFTGVAGVSAACIFWMPIPETFVLGSLSMFPALALAAKDPPAGPLAHLLSQVASLSVTITNWMTAVFSSLTSLPRRRFFGVTALAVAIAAAFGIAHRFVFPGSVPQMGDTTGDFAWVLSVESGGALNAARAFFFGGMVVPEIRFIPNWRHPAWPLMTFQFGGLGTGPSWAGIATLAWAGLLALGAYALFTLNDRPRLKTTLMLTLLYQLLLHVLYGRETFLYAMHYLPLLLICAALSTKTKWRPVALVLAVLLIPTAAINNHRSFAWARSYTLRAPGLKTVKTEIEARVHQRALPADPTWSYRFWRDLNWGRSSNR